MSNTDFFITVDENIYGIRSKRVNILYLLFKGPTVPSEGGPSIAFLLGLCIGSSVNGVCFVIICSPSLSVPREGCASYLDISWVSSLFDVVACSNRIRQNNNHV